MRDIPDVVKDYLLRHKVIIGTFLVTLIVSQFFNPWALPEAEDEFLLSVAGLAKPVQWALSVFWSGFSDLFGMMAYAVADGRGEFMLFVMAVYAVIKMIDIYVTQRRDLNGAEDGFLVKYMRSNVLFTVTAYAAFFLYPLIGKYLTGPAFIVIGVVLMALVAPTMLFALIYMVSFYLSVSLIGGPIGGLGIPHAAVIALQAAAALALALLTDLAANKAFELLVRYVFSKIPILNRLFY